MGSARLFTFIVPAPLVGEGQGGGESQTAEFRDSPRPCPLPTGGRGTAIAQSVRDRRAA